MFTAGENVDYIKILEKRQKPHLYLGKAAKTMYFCHGKVEK